MVSLIAQANCHFVLPEILELYFAPFDYTNPLFIVANCQASFPLTIGQNINLNFGGLGECNNGRYLEWEGNKKKMFISALYDINFFSPNTQE